MKTYRVSHIEAFRQWEQDEELDVAWLLSRMFGNEPPTEAMIAGTKLHKALEESPTGIEADELEVDGYRYRFLGEFEVELSPIRELRAFKTYVVDGQPIVIGGQVDVLHGKRIDDHKTTARFDPERYLEGYQWRLYCDIFGADRFRWNVFEMKWNDDDGCYDVFAAHRLEQCRYPGLGADCQALVERFARFVREHHREAA